MPVKQHATGISSVAVSTAPTPGQQRSGTNTPNARTTYTARQGEELIRQLSAIEVTHSTLSTKSPKSEYPALALTGRVISASFCVPYKFVYCTGHDLPWNVSARHGTSALFEHLAHLSSDQSKWKHTLVGWTGEIRQQSTKSPAENHPSGQITHEITPLNRASAPISPNASTVAEFTDHDALTLTKKDRLDLEQALIDGSLGEVLPVWLLSDLDKAGDVAVLKDQNGWRRYAEYELYNLFHYRQNLPSDGKEIQKTWANFQKLNNAFADRIVETYQPGDLVMIHDYHLMLLPGLLRQRVPDMRIGFFLHVPFPSYEFFRCLSRRKELLEGLLGADMITFQAFSYADHFKSCCQRPPFNLEASTNGVEAFGRHISIEVLPIGINFETTQASAFGDPAVEEKLEAVSALYEGQKIIVGRDRLDSVRGVAQKLQAFEIFLERNPEWHGKVVLIQVTSPTSIEEKERGNDKTANEIADLVARINGTYGSLKYTPVHHYPQYLSREEYFALLRIADVGLITSVRDGMNTTSLEYVVAQKFRHAPLILSEFSGTAYSLTDAIQINPWDLGGTANAIHRALLMTPEQKKTMHEKLYRYVKENTVQHWTDRLFARFLTNMSTNSLTFSTPVLDKNVALAQYRQSSKRLFMFDYDGTLTPIVKDPNSAVPTDRVTRNLKALAADPRNAVWIISGRDQSFLEEWLGHIPQLGLSAEHGSFLRHPHHDTWENLTETEDMSWQENVLHVFRHYTERTSGSVIERKRIAITWHYRRADPVLGKYQANECKQYLEDTVAKDYAIEVMPGKANLEVRPRFVNKGEIAKRLINDYGQEAGAAPEFVFCVGDDFTDEDMFKSLRNSNLPIEHVFCVTVGTSTKKTLASWHVLEPADVISTISLLNESLHTSGVSNGAA